MLTKERARAIMRSAQEMAGSLPWAEYLRKVMDQAEQDAVQRAWIAHPNGSMSWADTLMSIANGEVECESAADVLRRFAKLKNPSMRDEAEAYAIYEHYLLDPKTTPPNEAAARIDLGDYLRAARVTFEDGNSFTTSLAAGLSDESIRDYYKPGTPFNIGRGEHDYIQRVKSVEIVR